MRVTQSYLTRKFMNNMNNNLNAFTRSSQKLSSQRRYDKVSEDPSAASRAYKVRDQLAENEVSSSRVRDARGELAAAEENLRTVNSIMSSAQERILQAKTGTVSSEQREIIAKEIESYQKEVLQQLNSSYGGKYLFAGSSNDTEPFTLDAGGNLFFNGVNVDTATSAKDFPENEKIYLDIGLGIQMVGSKPDGNTAFQISTSGIDALGFGTNKAGLPNNLISLLGDAAKAIRSGNTKGMGEIHTQILDKTQNLMMSITDIGTRDAYLGYNESRLSSEDLQLKALQKSLEGIELEQETIYNKTYEMAWMATLQLGSKVLPPSIFDFMR